MLSPDTYSPRQIAFAAIMVSSVFWATAGVTAKLLLPVLDPFPLAFWRFFIAAVVLLPVILKLPRAALPEMLKRILPIALLSTANITLFYLALTRTTANATAIIYAATPLVSAILAQVFLKERLSRHKLIGICTGLIGVLLILIVPLWERGEQVSGDTLGNLLTFAAAMCWAGYSVGSRRLTTVNRYSPVVVSAVSIALSAVLFLLISSILPHRNFIEPLGNVRNLLLVLHLAILVTVLPYLLFQWSIKHTSTATALLTNYIQPVFSVLLGMIVLGEPVTHGFLLGSTVVFAGMFIYTSHISQPLVRRFWDRFTG